MSKNEKAVLPAGQLRRLVLRWLAAFAPTQIENGKLREGALSLNEALAKCQADLGEDISLSSARFRGLAAILDVQFDVRKSGKGNKSPVVAQLLQRVTSLELQLIDSLTWQSLANTRIAGLSERLNRIESQMQTVEFQIDSLVARLDQNEEQLRGVHKILDTINVAISTHRERLDAVADRLDSLEDLKQSIE